MTTGDSGIDPTVLRDRGGGEAHVKGGSTPLRIGLISDTHGLLRPEALEAMRGCDRIIHAGDIGGERILETLRRLAPVDAIRGNIDRAEWAAALPERLDLTVGGVRIHVLHDLKQLGGREDQVGAQVVVSGHSHEPGIHQHAGVLLVNPGSAGPRRFRLPVSIGYLHIEGSQARGELRILE